MGKILYSVNHNYFREMSLESCYWAGFIAADGNISKTLITVALAEKDENQIIRFKNQIQSTHPIKFNNKGDFVIKRFYFCSKQISRDLDLIYNITDRKSLTLKAPVNLTNEQKDAYICGYIDGDGCICLSKSRNSPFLIISILGTESVLSFIRERFNEILNDKLRVNINHKPGTNIFRLSLNSNKARDIFNHYYSLPIHKLNRKWNPKISEYARNYKRKELINFK